MLTFLGMEWAPGCLEFHITRRKEQSASLWQVRKPMYTRSIARWHHYERHLAPLLAVFGRD